MKLTQISGHDKLERNFALRGRRSYADGGVFFIFKVEKGTFSRGRKIDVLTRVSLLHY